MVREEEPPPLPLAARDRGPAAAEAPSDRRLDRLSDGGEDEDEDEDRGLGPFVGGLRGVPLSCLVVVEGLLLELLPAVLPALAMPELPFLWPRPAGPVVGPCPRSLLCLNLTRALSPAVRVSPWEARDDLGCLVAIRVGRGLWAMAEPAPAIARRAQFKATMPPIETAA